MISPNNTAPAGEFILFQSEDGQARVECRFETDTLWLTQAMLTELYGKAKATISEHISNVFEEGELDHEAVVRLLRTTASDGKTYHVQHYNLPLVIAVGYRVRSSRGTQFRHRTTRNTQDYIVKGFFMDDKRLKNSEEDRLNQISTDKAYLQFHTGARTQVQLYNARGPI